MNTIKEIERINLRELELGVKGSWHDEYKDSAYVFIGGLSYEMTEGDVIIVFSQWGEVVDINLPRDKETGKTRGFGFLMYEDQRSTVLAVDNMNGAQILGRTIRVDHCKSYKQAGTKNEKGEHVEPENPTYNAMPPLLEDSDSSEESDPADEIDLEDPMAAYLRAEKKQKRIKGKREREGEDKEERRARKAAKRAKKEAREKEKMGGSKDAKESLRRKESRRSRHGDEGRNREMSPGRRSRDEYDRNESREGHRSEYKDDHRDLSEGREKIGKDGGRGRDNDRDRDRDMRNGRETSRARADRDDWREGRWELERQEKSLKSLDAYSDRREDGRHR
ncbi:RNA-binding domain-containing protein, X-linked 2 [Tremella mesenterica]|uniref:RNA-binding domain-containing protein, X-linked 2 n=1 Tax=Tremella mesenterica TaxID=5217 RepID=A0A4Q1BJH5_TREME|nr:RNA-binding domain-containing protein, X-linked 2 [Tremella mesenterica]